MDFYIQFVKVMQNENLFDGYNLHVKCLQYYFRPLIKCDLFNTKNLWNEHRKQAVRNNLFGKPFVLFNMPENYGSKDHKKHVDIGAIEKLIEKFTVQPQLADLLFDELVILLLPDVSIANSPELT